MSFPRAPWWMYIIAASLLGNFAMNIYSYLRGPEPPFSQYTFARDALVVEDVLPNSALKSESRIALKWSVMKSHLTGS